MRSAKSYMAPFWSLISLVLLVAGFYAVMIINVKGLSLDPGFYKAIFLQLGIVIVILIGEAVVYYIFRKRIVNRMWAILHIALLYIALIVIPVILVFAGPVLAQIFTRSDYQNSWSQVAMIRSILFWTTLIIGHAFFILTIAKGYSIKDANTQQRNDSDLFNDFAS